MYYIKYFSSKNNELLSYENLDDFLKEIELYDMKLVKYTKIVLIDI